MNYRETLDFLALRGNEVQTMHLGLHRTIAMMQALGRPQDSYPTVHIAGTNGKGSVAAMCEAILRQAGLTTGLYTSPHLVRVEERMRIDGVPITPRAFAAVASRIRATETNLLQRGELDRLLTTFEFLTCCAFFYFASKRVDIAVIEVGLGGKLDSTNVITPHVSVITSIALDHQYILGNTLSKIAVEKAGIIKAGVPAVSGCCIPAPRRVIQKRAKEVGAPLTETCDACDIRITPNLRGRHSFDLKTAEREYRNLHLSLLGEHQISNAALAVLAIEALRAFPIRAGEIRRGLARTQWVGRLDEYRSRRRTLLDGAHNPEGAQRLREFLKKKGEREVRLVFGAVREKDVFRIGSALFSAVDSIHLAPLRNTRSMDPADVAAMHRSYSSKMKIHRHAGDALRAAWKECSSSGLVVVTGSLYLVGELLPLVRKYVGKQP